MYSNMSNIIIIIITIKVIYCLTYTASQTGQALQSP